MKLTIIRHTRVDVPSEICYGQTDVPVAETYSEEMENVKKKIKKLSFDATFCSPLSRCKKLANDLFPGNSIQYDDRLKELNFGEWEYKKWDDIFHTEEGRFWMDNYATATCKGGESLVDFQNRLTNFFDELNDKNHNSVGVVAHAGVISLMKVIVEKMSVEEVYSSFKTDYGGIYEFEYNGSK